MRQLMTTRGYVLLEVASALQKAIRRGDARLAGYWAIELFESNYKEYLWRRLLTISAEDCWGLITHEVEALYRSWQIIDKQKPGGGRIFASKATILLCLARKCRDADHLTNLVYDPKAISDDLLEEDLARARESTEPIPDYAYDVHTQKGRKAGKTKAAFFRDEYDALMRLDDLYAKSIAGQDIRTALQAQRELNRLLDLYAGSSSVLHPPDGEDDAGALRRRLELIAAYLLPLGLTDTRYPVEEHARVAAETLRRLPGLRQSEGPGPGA